MIGVMFTWDSKITDDEGRPLTKIYMHNNSERIPGVKNNGIRPIIAYVFSVQGSNLPEMTDILSSWLHNAVSYALHPLNGKIVYQTKELKRLFSFQE